MAVGGGITQDARARLDRCDRDLVDIDYATEHLGLRSSGPWFEALDLVPDSEKAYIRRVIQHHGSKSLVGEPKVQLSTIHAAKGGEADHVVLLTDISRKVRAELFRSPDDERRVFYVGLTRPRSTLQLVGMDNPLFKEHLR